MFSYQTHPYKTPPELEGASSKTYPVTIVGAGPVGLTLALALAKQGIQVVLLDDNNQVSVGSRAICFAKRSLEIFDKLGVAKPMIEKGVRWNVGRIFYRDKEIDHFDLLPEKVAKYPAFINLQQYYVEHFLIEAVLKEEKIDVRWLNKVLEIEQQPSEGLKPSEGLVNAKIETPEGAYTLKTNYLVACDGSRSTIRNLLNLEMQGSRFEERFLIADFKMEADFPSERWFWFDPPFARGQSILLHKQPDNLWRLDFKLGKTADSALANDHDFIKEKIRSVIGERPFELDWTSIYSFSSKKLDSFVHQNIIFIGDAAHVVSPFGARGANSGIEDADNLSWKLKFMISNFKFQKSEAKILRGGKNPIVGVIQSHTVNNSQLTTHNSQLIKTFDAERTAAAAQNIACTGETNLFIAPPSEAAMIFRNQILEKAETDIFAKKQINCGRLSVPSVYGKYKNSEEGDWKNPNLGAGRCIKDCFLVKNKTYLIEKLGYDFTILIQKPNFKTHNSQLTTHNSIFTEGGKKSLKKLKINVLAVHPTTNKTLIDLYELTENAAYLITPDQYILGRWKNFYPQNAIDLVKTYLSGQVFESETLVKTEQEQIDEQVANQIKSLSNAYLS